MRKYIQKIYQRLLFFATTAVLAINGGIRIATIHNGGGGAPSREGFEAVPQSTFEIFPRWFQKPDLLPDTDIWMLFKNITGFLTMIAIPLATIFYIWAAFLYLTSGGAEKRIKAAHQTVLYTTIGLAVVLSAEALAAIVKDVFSMSGWLIG